MDYARICINCMHEKQNPQEVCPNCGFNPSTYKWPSYALEPYTILNGKYLVGRVLGAGGFGITYIAYDMMLECTRAIKEFFLQGSMYRMSSESTGVSVVNGSFPQEQMYKVNREKFMQEARLLAKLDHLPGIVSVYDFFNENDTSYMVLEYLEGMTLKDYVKSRGGRLNYQEVLEKVHPVINSLEQLHDRRIYHRDISPDNIMVMKDGSLKLFDFGGARVQSANNDNRSVMVMKKSGYTPVEQYVDGEQGPWTDEYAMAATIYYCICGAIPPESVTRTAGADTLKKPSVLVPGIPQEQEEAIMKGLGLRKEDRYPDMYAFEKALYKESEKGKKKTNGKKGGNGASGGNGGSGNDGGNGGGKKILLVLLLLALLGGGGFAAYMLLGGGHGKSYEVTVKNGQTGEQISSFSYETGSMVTVEADDMEQQGYGFEKWTGDTSAIGVEAEELEKETLQFKMPDQKVSLTAEYAGLPYEVALEGSDPDIVITADPQKDTYQTGEKVTLTAQVAQGWDFAGWVCDNEAAQFSDPDSTETVFTVPAGGGVVSAQKTEHAWILTVENGASSDGNYAYLAGEQAAIIADEAPEGERFLNWTVEGADAGILKDAQSERTTLTMPGADITVRANFSEKTYGLYIPDDCTILEGEAEADGTYRAGTQITVEATVADGYKFDRWEILGNGELKDADLTQNPLTFAMPASELSLVAKTTENKVYVSATGVKGYEQPVAFRPGDTVTLEADVEGHQAEGKAFDRWSITGAELGLDEGTLTNPVLTFTMPEADLEIEAQFIDIDYYVTVQSETGAEPEILTFHMGDVVKLEAALEDAEADRAFAGWTVDAGNIEPEYAGTADSVISFSMPGEDVTLTKHYQPVMHTLTVKTQAGEQKTEYAKGDSASAEADSVADGMRFVRWEVTKGSLDLGESVLTNPKLSFTMPAEDITIEAQYEEIEYTVTVTYDADGETRQYGYHKGEQVEIEAPAHNDELDLDFAFWSIDSNNITLEDTANNMAVFEMPEENVTLTAHYKETEHILTVRMGSAENTYPYVQGAEVAIGTSEEFEGMHFMCWEVESGNVTLEDPSALKAEFKMPAEDVVLLLHYGYVLSVNGGVIEGSDGYGTDVFEEGTQVTIHSDSEAPTPFTGWNWMSIPDGFTAPTEQAETLTFTMPGGDVEVTAEFEGEAAAPAKVETGYYFIAAAANNNLLVTTDEDIPQNGISLSMHAPAEEDRMCLAQLFYFEEYEEGMYHILKVTGKGDEMYLALNAKETASEDQTNVSLRNFRDGEEQKWLISPTGDAGRNWFRIQSEYGTILTAGVGAEEGTAVSAKDNAGVGLHQKWELIPFNEEDIPVISRYTLKVNNGKIDGTYGAEIHSYIAGEKVAVIADIAPEGQIFSKWSGDDLPEEFGNADTRTGWIQFTMPSGDLELTAEFSQNNDKTSVIPNGKYVFSPEADISKLIYGTGNNVEVQNFFKENLEASMFNVEYQEDGYYKIIHEMTGMSLTSTENMDVVLAEFTGSTGQRWYIETTGEGHYRIHNDFSDGLLGCKNGNAETGSVIVIDSGDDNLTKCWCMYLNGYYDINPDSAQIIRSGFYKIAASDDEKMLVTVDQGVHESRTVLVLEPQIEDPELCYQNQYFYVEFQGDGQFKISPAIDIPKEGDKPEDKLTLDVTGATSDDGVALQLYNYHAGESQQWHIYATGDFGSRLVFIGSSLNTFITVPEGIWARSPVQMFQFNASTLQKWRLIP